MPKKTGRNRPPSVLLRKLYIQFHKEHEATMEELLGQAYKEGWNNCIEEYELKNMRTF